MSEIPASLVKQLRDATGAGMMECKRALQETDGDLDAARTLLRERGMALAGKRAGRATSEGLVGYHQSEGRITMVAVGCETEPVSKNDEFQTFAKKVLDLVDEEGPDSVAQLEQERVDLVGKLGENILVTGAERCEAVGAGETLGAYVHPPANKLGVVVKLAGGSPELARQLAMHISFGRPEWLSKEDVPAEIVAAEKQILLNSDELEGKPEQAKEKIVEGMLAKRFFAAQPGGTLTEQPWIHDSAKTVGKALGDSDARVLAFRLLAVAE
ncbi:MAG: translation elongation factor Ts [Gaiellaceae bacterium]